MGSDVTPTMEWEFLCVEPGTVHPDSQRERAFAQRDGEFFPPNTTATELEVDASLPTVNLILSLIFQAPNNPSPIQHHEHSRGCREDSRSAAFLVLARQTPMWSMSLSVTWRLGSP